MRRWRRLVSRVEDAVLVLRAYGDAFAHALRGHRVVVLEHAEPWAGILGDLSCETCDLGIWIHYSPLLNRAAQVLCSRLGHPGAFEWQRCLADGSAIGAGTFGCERCLAPMPAPQLERAA